MSCKHLDYETRYGPDIELVQIEGTPDRFWRRGPTWCDYPGAPRDVQFCKLRGRLNDRRACLTPGEARCSEYHEPHP